MPPLDTWRTSSAGQPARTDRRWTYDAVPHRALPWSYRLACSSIRTSEPSVPARRRARPAARTAISAGAGASSWHTVTDRMPLRRAAASSTSPRATASATGSAGGSQVPRPAT